MNKENENKENPDHPTTPEQTPKDRQEIVNEERTPEQTPKDRQEIVNEERTPEQTPKDRQEIEKKETPDPTTTQEQTDPEDLQQRENQDRNVEEQNIPDNEILSNNRTQQEKKPDVFTNLDNMPVQVHFEVGKITLPLGKLKELNPGYKMPTDIIPRYVNLTVDNKIVGKGEMVEVGDIVGIKIIEIY